MHFEFGESQARIPMRLKFYNGNKIEAISVLDFMNIFFIHVYSYVQCLRKIKFSPFHLRGLRRSHVSCIFIVIECNLGERRYLRRTQVNVGARDIALSGILYEIEFVSCCIRCLQ